MKNGNFILKFYIVTLILISGCATNAVNTLRGGEYNSKTNTTEYFVLPYGKVMIPGKWHKTKYLESSRQQFFTNSDSIVISISFGACNKYEFNQDGVKKGFEFVEAYYNWDSKYFADKYGLNTPIIEKNIKQSFIIWRVNGEIDSGTYDTYFLFGANDCLVSIFSVSNTKKWNEKGKVAFLKNLFLEKN